MRRLALAALAALALAAAGCLPKNLVQAQPGQPGKPALDALQTPTPTPAPQAVQNQPVKEDRPIKVASRRLTYNHKTGQTHFMGGVTVTQDSTTLNADELLARTEGGEAHALGGVRITDSARKVTVMAQEADYGNRLQNAELRREVRLYTVDPYGRSVTVTAERARYWGVARQAELDGGVTLTTRGSLTATAGCAFYDETAGSIMLSGTAKVARGRNRFSADRITYYSGKSRVTLKGKVKAAFIPEEVEALSKER